MDIQDISPGSGYSPAIAIELILHGRCFNVASTGKSSVILRSPQAAAPGCGTIRMEIDGRLTIYHVELPSGINPEHPNQPIVILSIAEEAAA